MTKIVDTYSFLNFQSTGTGKIKCGVLLILGSVKPTLNFSRACDSLFFKLTIILLQL